MRVHERDEHHQCGTETHKNTRGTLNSLNHHLKNTHLLLLRDETYTQAHMKAQIQIDGRADGVPFSNYT